MDLQSSIDKAYADLDLESKIDSAYTDIEQQDAADRAAAASDLMGIGYTQEDIDRKPGFTATSTLGKVAEALPAKVAAGGMEAARSALSLANFIPAVNRTRRYMAQAIKEEVDPYGTTGNWLADSALEAVKSTTQSLTNMAMFGGVGGLLGAIAGKGLLFGTNEYADFVDEVKDIAVKQGMSDAEVSKRLADARIPGIISGLAEMGGEWASDFVGAKLLGLTGKVVKEPVKKLLARGAGAWGAEVLGEEGTTAAQHYARQAAELQTESLAKEMIDTLGVAGIQAGMMIPMGAGVARRRRAQLTDTLTDMGVEPEAAKQKAAEVFSVAETQGQSAAEKVLWDTIEEQKQKAPERTVITSVIDKLIADSAEPGRVAVEGMLARPVTEQEESSMMPIDDFYDDYTDALRVQQEVQVIGREFGLSRESKLFDFTDVIEGNRIEEVKEHAKSLRGNEGQLPVRGTISEEGQNKGSEDIQLTEEQREEGVQTSAEQQAQGNVAQTKEVIASAEEEGKAEGQTQTEVLTQRPVSQGGAMPHLDKLAQALFEDDLTGVIAPNKEAAQQIVEKAGADRFQMTMHGADYVILPIGSVIGKKEKATIRRLQTNYTKRLEYAALTEKEVPDVDYVPMSPADIQAGLKADADTNEGLLQQLTAKVDNWFRGKRNGAGYQDLYAEVEGWIDTAKNSKWKGQFIDVLRRLELAREAAGNPDQLTRLLLQEPNFRDCLSLGIMEYGQSGGSVKQWLRAMKNRLQSVWNRVRNYVYMVRHIVFDQDAYVSIAVPFQAYGQGSMFFTTSDKSFSLPNYTYSLADAMMMRDSGMSDADILAKTGFQKIHKWWFYRLPTDDVPINWSALRSTGRARLSDMIDIPELYDRIPDAANVTVVADPYIAVGDGFYDHSVREIHIGFTSGVQYSYQLPFIHELNHAVQNFQGTATGSSPLREYWKMAIADMVSVGARLGALQNIINSMSRANTKEAIDKKVGEFNKELTRLGIDPISKPQWSDALTAYNKQLGEIMANIGMYGDINKPLILDKGYLVRVTGRGTDYEALPEPNRLHISARIADTTDALEQGQMRKQDAIAANSTIIDKRPKDINAITPWFRHSWFAASSDIAKRLVFSITNAEKLYNVRVQNELDMKDNITKYLTKEERHQVMTLGNAVSRDMKKLRKLLKDNEVDNIDEVMREFKDWTIEQYAPSAKVAAVYSTIDKTIYQRYRKMIKANLMRELRFHTNPQFVAAIDNYAALVQQGVDDVTALLTAMTSNIAQDPVQYKKFGAVLADYIDQAKAISEWGDDDYWSHFMRGSLVLKNKDGKIVTVAVTPDQAAARIQEYADGHPDQGPYTMDDSFIYTDSLPTLVGRRHYFAIRNRLANAIKTVNSEMGRAEAQQKVGLALRRVLGTKPASVFAGPLLTTRNVLPGEEDIDVVLSTYIQIVTKKLTYDPVIWQVRRDVGQLPRNERQHVEDVLASAKGVYDQIERAFDDFVRLLFPNTKGRNLSRAVSNSRTVTAALKLGYRPIASVLNGLDATARIWIEHHEQAMARGMAWMATPEGKQIVDKYSWALGARPFEEAGHFKGGIRFLGHNYKGWMQVATPLGMYNIAEFPARKLNFAVAYTQYMSDVKGATEEAAADFAIRSVDMLQGANVISALPKLMRNPVGRAFTLFMPFVVRTVEWMAANINNPQFWGRFLPYMLAVGGPRGIAMMLKSLPFWALLSVFMGSDRLEEWYLSIDEWLQRKLGGAASGLPGLAGIDIVAPATIQLPTQPDQWAGAVVSTLLKGSMQATQAIFDYNRAAELKDIAKRQAPFIRNYWDVIDAIIDDYGNVWDVNGNIKYNLYNNYDKVVVAAGAKPVTKAYEETATRLNKMAVRRENKVKDDILDWATNQLVVMTRRGFTSSDLPDSFYAKLLDRMAAHNITVDSLTSRLNESQQAKGLGMVLSSPKLYRIDVYNRLEEAGNTFNTNFLQPQR